MRALLPIIVGAACLAPVVGFANAGAGENSPGFAALPSVSVAISPAARAADPDPLAQLPALDASINLHDLKALVELGVRHAHAEGVPKDQNKANQLFCHAARYGNADGFYNLGWVYANGRGVQRDDSVAAALFRRAADRGHAHAAKLLEVLQEKVDVALPTCALPTALPVAVPLPPRPASEAESEVAEHRIPMAPKEIVNLVQTLAPRFEIDSNLALAVIYAESAFNPQALSSANAQGLMQLIPETASRFGVKQPFNPSENIKGGLAYLRWLLAYFQGDVPLVLAAYNAGEGAVEKFKGIPPYNETRDYVKKITNMYRRLTHPYNAGVVAPSPVISQLKQQRMM